MAISAKQAIKNYYVQLINEVPLENTQFYGLANQADLFPLGSGADVQAKATRAEKVAYLLNSIVEPGADYYLPILLQVMRNSKMQNLVKLANEIQAAINGISYVIILVQFVV